MKQIAIYFYQKINHRERQKDTFRYAPKRIKKFSSLKNDIDLTDKNQETKWKKNRFINKVEQLIVNYIPIVNIKRLPADSNKAEMIYTRWDIPRKSKIPFIIELDNPYILSYYNTFALKLFKPLIRTLLLQKKCHKIVCLSEACQLSLEKELGKKIKEKSIVLYPRMKDNTRKKNKNKKWVIFTFVWWHPRRKGVPELLIAFNQIKESNIELNLIWFQNNELEGKYKKDSRIKFIGKLKRKEILDNYLPQTDIFVLPSMHESFGVSVLEALSFWCWIIAVDTYAIPEMVKSKTNGILIPHPFFLKTTMDSGTYIDTPQYTMWQFEKKFMKWSIRKNLVKDIKIALQSWIKNKKKRQTESKKIFQKRFSPNKRETTRKQIVSSE